MITDYGSDLDCTDDLDPLMRELPGDSPRIVAQSSIRRLSTPRGGLVHDADYGTDLRVLCRNPDITNDRITAMIRGEILKDIRVRSVDCLVEKRAAVDQVGFSISVSVVTEFGPFRLVGELQDEQLRMEVIA